LLFRGVAVVVCPGGRGDAGGWTASRLGVWCASRGVHGSVRRVRWCDAGKRSDGGVPTAASPRSSLVCIGPVMTVSGRVRVFGCAGVATPLPRTSTLLSVSLPRGLLTPGWRSTPNPRQPPTTGQ